MTTFKGTYVQDPQEVEELLELLTVPGGPVAIDTETSWIEDGSYPSLMGMSLAFGEPLEAYYLPFRHSTREPSLMGPEVNLDLGLLMDLNNVLFKSVARPKLFHNFKFDIKVLEAEGCTVADPLIDTLLVAHLVNENHYAYQLEYLSKVCLGDENAYAEKKAIANVAKQFKGWNNIPGSAMAKYACSDSIRTWRLYEAFWPRLEKQGLVNYWNTVQLPFARILDNIERRGVQFDVRRAEELRLSLQDNLAAIQSRFGFDLLELSSLARYLFQAKPEGLGLTPVALSKNALRPPVSLSDGRTLAHVPVQDRAALLALAAACDGPSRDSLLSIVEYRTLHKRLSTWIDGFVRRTHSDGRVHTSFKVHGTRTGRLSSEKPNMQQLPREDAEEAENQNFIKTLFSAPPGYKLIEFDYSQIEFRLSAVYSQDEALLEAYRNGLDIHQVTATQLGLTRTNAKTLVYAILFEAGGEQIAKLLGCSISEGVRLKSEFWKTYSGVAKMKKTAMETAYFQGEVALLTGRKRHLNESEAFKAYNSIIQGGAAEIMKLTMIKLNELGEQPWKMVNQVHDSLWIEVPEVGFDEHVSQIKEIMEWPSAMFPIEFTVDWKEVGK